MEITQNSTHVTIFQAINLTTEVPQGINATDIFGYYDTVTTNSTNRFTAFDYHEPKYSEPVMVVICIILGSMILAILLGNIFVITAILVEKSLQGVSNYLILSLAMTDMLVAVLVMPLSLINEISVHWFLGNAVCDMWISMDVLCCTASILHLVAIAFDRYWAVSNIDYVRRRSARQILMMVVIVWTVSVFISIPPLFGWRHDSDGPDVSGMCLISQEHGYTIFSTVGAFYCPLLLMLIINYKIYRAARYRIRKKGFGICATKRQALHEQMSAVETSHYRTNQRHSSGSDISQEGISMFAPSCVHGNNINNITTVELESPVDIQQNGQIVHEIDSNLPPFYPGSLNVPRCSVPLAYPGTSSHSNNNCINKRIRRNEKDGFIRREKIEMRRERRAARVLGIVTGAFVVCWLPFFIVALLSPVCGEPCNFPYLVYSAFTWLGYFNSLINPIIYTIFNPSFRCAFNKVFFNRLASVNRTT